VFVIIAAASTTPNDSCLSLLLLPEVSDFPPSRMLVSPANVVDDIKHDTGSRKDKD